MTNGEIKNQDIASGFIDKKELLEKMETGEIENLMVGFCDMQGRLMGKRLTADFCLNSDLDEGTNFCNYLLGTGFDMEVDEGYSFMNWDNGYGDWTASPDWSTLRIIPWQEKTAMVFADVLDKSLQSQIPIAPRNVLKQQLNKAEQKGYHLFMASELEFYLFDESFESVYQKGYSNMQTAGHIVEDYNLLQGTRNEHFYQSVRQYMEAADIPIESSKGEASVGQHELNFVYSNSLKAADDHIMFKHGIKELGMKNNQAITFMAKPYSDWAGSSGHIHLSLWDTSDSNNEFYSDNGDKYGMSDTMQHFLAGVLAYTRDFSLMFAPYVNSYKRYAQNSWAPVNICWSSDNRTAGYRVAGKENSLRIETRIPGADMNPYLAYSALIGAGLYGIDNQMMLEDELIGNAYEAGSVSTLPASLNEAINCWKSSKVVEKVLGKDVADHYLNAAELEQQRYDSFVTHWERQRYFEQV